MAPAGEGPATEPTDRALRALVADERRREQVAERRRRGALRAQADETWTLDGVVRTAGAAAARVEVLSPAGSAAGAICEVGRDYVAVRTGSREVRLVPAAAITAVRLPGGPQPEASATHRAAPPPVALDLEERLRDLARRHMRVDVVAGRLRTTGRLASVGDGAIAVGAADGVTSYVALASLDAIDLRG